MSVELVGVTEIEEITEDKHWMAMKEIVSKKVDDYVKLKERVDSKEPQ